MLKNELIKVNEIKIGEEDQRAANARDLWKFLESKRDFSNWIKDRIEKYGFVENEDFAIARIVDRKAVKIEYIITLDTAKELAMVENNEKGKLIRKYFIEAEKKYKKELQNMSNGPEPIEIDPPSSSTGGNQGRGQKRRRTEGVGGTSLPGTAGAMGGGGMEQAVEPIPRPMYSAHTQIRYFKKVHRILTFGLAYKPIVKARTGPPAYSDVYMMTSLAHIPWEYPFMYLNPSEFALLPAGSRAKHVRCKVKSENVRVAFPTNSTDNNLATLHTNKFLRVGINLNQKNSVC